MHAKILVWARLAFIVCALFLSIGILVAALASERSRFDANEFFLLLAIVGLGLIAYREFASAFRVGANKGGLGDAAPNDGTVQNGAAINDVRSSDSGSLIHRLKQRRALTLIVLLCVLSFPVALVGVPAVLDDRRLSGHEILLIVFLEIVVVACLAIAWRRISRLLK